MDFNLGDETETETETFALSKIQQVQLDFKRYENTLAGMRETAKKHTIIDDTTNEQAVVLAGQSKAMFKAIEKKRKEVIAPAAEFTAAVNQLVKPLTAGLTGIETVLKQKITRYAQEQEKKRLEAQRKAQEEAQRLQDEINKAAAAVQETPAVVVAPVVTEAPKVTRTASGSASITTTWTFEVDDFAALPDQYKSVDTVGLNKAVKAGTRQIPGVKIYEVQKTSIRSASLPSWDDEKF